METKPIPDDTLEALNAKAKSLGFTDSAEYLRDHLGIAEDVEPSRRRFKIKVAHKTKHGKILNEDSLRYMRTYVPDQSVDLIVTSPPFCLVKKKEYGNEDPETYMSWFAEFGREFKRILKPKGSLVIDVGGAWNKGLPTRSLYHFEMVSMLCRRFGFHLAQEFYWWNPARLPTPAEWVTIRKIRVKDAVNVVWWLSPTPFPKANNQRVKWPYSDSQKDLIERGTYNAGTRPSGHKIKAGTFNKDSGGAIAPNLIALANTESSSTYSRYCEENGIPKHPARFPTEIPEMFIRMLTDKGDTVFDPFGGSCTTGEAAERLERNWICCELEPKYIRGAKGRFGKPAKEPDRERTRAPYKAHAPNQIVVDDLDVPLPKDGGKDSRRKR